MTVTPGCASATLALSSDDALSTTTTSASMSPRAAGSAARQRSRSTAVFHETIPTRTVAISGLARREPPSDPSLHCSSRLTSRLAPELPDCQAYGTESNGSVEPPVATCGGGLGQESKGQVAINTLEADAKDALRQQVVTVRNDKVGLERP